MMRRWLSVALAAGWLGWATGLSAQPTYIPTPYGAARYSEPIPEGPSTAGGKGTAKFKDLVPGPLNPQLAPPGPSEKFSLPANHTSAFQCENGIPDEGIYFHIGLQGLQRQTLGHGPVAFYDPQGQSTGEALNQVDVLGFQDLSQPMHWGVKGSLGYFLNGEVIEGSVLAIFDSTRGRSVSATNSLNVPFTNPPAGFEGNFGLFLQANAVNMGYTTSLTSPEINYRYTSVAVVETEIIMGIRYVDLRENLFLTTSDDGVNLNDATYRVQTQNRFVGAQIGFEASKQLGSLFTIGSVFKTSVGPNWADVRTRLTRGDGLIGFDARRTVFGLGQLYDLGAYIDFNPLQRCHIRAGYTALWLLGQSLAIDHFDFDLSNIANPKKNNEGSVFYHGPSFELQFLF